MKMRKRIKKGSTWFLALTVFMSAMVISDVNAANGIEVDRECSIMFELGGDLYEENAEFAELKELPVPVKLYRVADVTVSGAYQTLDAYKALDLEHIDSGTTAVQWEEMAKQATDIIVESEKTPETAIQPDEEVELVNGRGTAGQLETGMYLVAAQEVLSPEYAYRFTPFLLSLPNHYYYSNEEKNDDWVYDVTTSLKPEKEKRLGSIVINKSLTSFNETLGNATFVFQVEAVKDGEKVYSDVVSLVFDGPGSKSLTIQGISAGAEVAVTEIYSGASYELTSEQVQHVTVVADSEDADGNVVVDEKNQAGFVNQYNNKLNGGASVVNHFERDQDQWKWTKYNDNTETQK